MATCTSEETMLMMPRRAVEVWCSGAPRWLCPSRTPRDEGVAGKADGGSCVDLVCRRSFIAKPFCYAVAEARGIPSRKERRRRWSRLVWRLLGMSAGGEEEEEEEKDDDDLNLTKYDTIVSLCEARPGLDRCTKLENFSTSVILVDAFTLAAENFVNDAQSADDFDNRLVSGYQIVGLLDSARPDELPDAPVIQRDLVRYLEAGHESVLALRAVRSRVKAETEWFERRLNFLAYAQPQRKYTSGIEMMSKQLVEEVADHLEHMYEKALEAVKKTELAYEAMAVFDRSVSRRHAAAAAGNHPSKEGEGDPAGRAGAHGWRWRLPAPGVDEEGLGKKECASIWCKIKGTALLGFSTKDRGGAPGSLDGKGRPSAAAEPALATTTDQLLRRLADATRSHHRAAREMFDGVLKISEDCRSHLTQLERLKPNPALSWKLVRAMLDKIRARNVKIASGGSADRIGGA